MGRPAAGALDSEHASVAHAGQQRREGRDVAEEGQPEHPSRRGHDAVGWQLGTWELSRVQPQQPKPDNGRALGGPGIPQPWSLLFLAARPV